jgi:hypothetical protein
MGPGKAGETRGIGGFDDRKAALRCRPSRWLGDFGPASALSCSRRASMCGPFITNGSASAQYGRAYRLAWNGSV